MKIYKALSVELRAGTQSYGTAYCEAGFANYRLLTTDFQQPMSRFTVADGHDPNVLINTVMDRMAIELEGIPEDADSHKSADDFLERIGFDRRFIRTLGVTKARTELNRRQLAELASQAAMEWHARYLDLHSVKNDRRLIVKVGTLAV